MLGSAIPRAPSATDVKPWQAGRFGDRSEGWRIPFGARRDALSRCGLSLTSGSPVDTVLWDQGRPAMSRPAGGSHRLAGSWAYDHGVAAHLSLQRGAPRNPMVLTAVSATRHSVLDCAFGRGWPYLRLREPRVYAYFVREIHRRLVREPPALFGRQATPPKRSGASLGMLVERLCLRNRASLRRTTALTASAAAHTTALKERVDGSAFGLATPAEAFGLPWVFGSRRTACGS